MSSTVDLRDETFLRKLNRYPHLRQRLEMLVDVVENASGDLTRADAAERRVIEEIRQLGQESLQSWAERQVEQTSGVADTRPESRRAGKKTLLAQHIRDH